MSPDEPLKSPSIWASKLLGKSSIELIDSTWVCNAAAFRAELSSSLSTGSAAVSCGASSAIAIGAAKAISSSPVGSFSPLSGIT